MLHIWFFDLDPLLKNGSRAPEVYRILCNDDRRVNMIAMLTVTRPRQRRNKAKSRYIRDLTWTILTHAQPLKIQFGCHSYASHQSDADRLRRQSVQCSWTSSLVLSADGRRTAGRLCDWTHTSLMYEIDETHTTGWGTGGARLAYCDWLL